MPFRISGAVRALIRVSKPEFKRPHDRVAYAVHAYYLCQGYTLVGLGDWKQDTPPSVDAEEIPVDGWNDDGQLYTFTYTHPELSPVTLKCMVMGNLLVICSAPLKSKSEPKTMNVDVTRATKEGDLMGGYTAFDDLVERFEKELGSANDTPEQTKTDIDVKVHPQLKHPTMDHPPGHTMGQPLPGLRDRIPGMIGSQSDRLPLGGNLIGINDPSFAPHLRYPELQHGRTGGIRFDPIGPPGMPGYRPDDFYSDRANMHPDVMPPGPGRKFDPDNMFG